MKTLLGTEIPELTRGVIYLCFFNHKNNTITVENELFCDSPGFALDLYAEIPNPESQIAIGDTHEKLCEELQRLHERLEDPVWLEILSEML